MKESNKSDKSDKGQRPSGVGGKTFFDKHFKHEVTSSQAFLRLQQRGLHVFRFQQVVATDYQNVPTQDLLLSDELSCRQVQPLTVNLEEQTIRIAISSNYKNTCLLNGYNDKGYLLSLRGNIKAFEATRI